MGFSPCRPIRPSAACSMGSSGTCRCCAGLTNSAFARPGSASITPRHGSPIRHPTCWWLALMQTKNIRIGPGGFLLPYHHPAELANRVAMLDHLSDGRLNFGVAASGLPSDWAMFNVDGMSGVNRDMTREALEIILKLWESKEPF